MFSSVNLFSYLKHLGIWAVGTIRSNRLRGAEKFLKNKKTLEAEGRGALDYVVDVNSNVVVVRWIDNGIVQLISLLGHRWEIILPDGVEKKLS